MTISAKILADSVNPSGVRMTTMEIEYPRFILAELNTHRMLSKNSASSRAIPARKLREHIKQHPAVPVHWGQNQPGMKARTQIMEVPRALNLWHTALDSAIYYHQSLEATGLHKQVANRIVEPWMTMKTVISGTEWANFWHLRNHEDAQPEIHELAAKMHAAYEASQPKRLEPGEWHVPYVISYRDSGGILRYRVDDREVDWYTAVKVSASCCAQVSYRTTDTSIEKALRIYDQLIESEPAHASPVEHQATPIPDSAYYGADGTHTWPTGVTHQTRDSILWSGNLRDWIQYRKTIPNEARW